MYSCFCSLARVAVQGVANGCWVLDVGWAAACLSAGAHVLEADWQVVGDQVRLSTGPLFTLVLGSLTRETRMA